MNVRELLLNHRISSGSSFTDLLPNTLPFKIPITRQSHINMSEQAVVILDGMWPRLFKLVAMTNILLDQHDA